MGDNPAPATATIYVYLVIEKPILEHDFRFVRTEIRLLLELDIQFLALTDKIEVWERYLDDTYSEFDGCDVEGHQLMEYVNQLHESIKFPETQISDTIVFLDFEIAINQMSRVLEFQLYIKPTNVGIFLNYNSAHPKCVLKSVAENELRRAVKRSNTESGMERGLQKIKSILLENDYPEPLINSGIRKIKDSMLEVAKSPIKRDYMEGKNILKLHYIDEQHKRKLLKELCKYNVINEDTRIIFIPGMKLSNLLIRSKLSPVKCNAHDGLCYPCRSQENPVHCMIKSFVYLLVCTICWDAYVGESGRLFRVRMREHYLSIVKVDSDNAMGAHYVKMHTGEKVPELPFNCSIIRRCRDFVDRKLWQSIEIKFRQPAINIQLMGSREHNLDWKI